MGKTILTTTQVESALEIAPQPNMPKEYQSDAETNLALPKELWDLPEWIRLPFSRFMRLKQRNWHARTVRRSTWQLFNRLNFMITFFIQRYELGDWSQLRPQWVEDYIDFRLREGKAPGTINVELSFLRNFCRFLIDEGYAINEIITKMKDLDMPRRLPRPLSVEQVRRLENCIQTALRNTDTDPNWLLTVRDLACFYLLWHCGLRISEVCWLLVNDIDIEARKLFVRISKERKDRVVYISDTAAMALQQYLAIRKNQDAIYVFTTRRGVMHPRTLQRRLAQYGQQCGVPVTAHRLRHTFASQMLGAGMPVTSLQRYLGHEHLDTTMIYAEVTNPTLQKDYYQGISAIDLRSEKMGKSDEEPSHQETLRKLVQELKTPDLSPTHRDEILAQMQALLEDSD